MALQCDPPYCGDIGDEESEPEPDPDRIYEAEIERRLAACVRDGRRDLPEGDE